MIYDFTFSQKLEYFKLNIDYLYFFLIIDFFCAYDSFFSVYIFCV